MDETLSSLRFGQRAKRIKTHVHVNRMMSPEQLMALVEALRAELTQAKRCVGLWLCVWLWVGVAADVWLWLCGCVAVWLWLLVCVWLSASRHTCTSTG
jgi:hypothetical protein